MAETIILQGPSGSGKSTSLRTMPVEQTLILTPNDKKLPWKGGDKAYAKRLKPVPTLDELQAYLQGEALAKVVAAGKVKYIIIEDFTHYMIERMSSTKFVSQNSGNATFERWKTMANDVMKAIVHCSKSLPKEVYIVVVHHTEADESGKLVFKIFGKLLRDSFDLVSFVRIVWHSMVIDKPKVEDRYVFLTNDDGIHQAKSPMGMFPEAIIPNDLYAALQAVEAYDKAE